MSQVDFLVGRLNENFRAISKARGVSYHAPPIEWFMSVPRGGVERVFNVTLDYEDAGSQIDSLILQIRSKEAPDAVLVTPKSTPADLDKILLSRGFTLLPEVHWAHAMALNLEDLACIPVPATPVPVEEVRTRDRFADWVDLVNRSLFGTALMKAQDFVNMLDLPNVTFYLGLLQGIPVGATMSVHDRTSSGFELTTVDKTRGITGLLRIFFESVLRRQRSEGLRSSAVFSHPDDSAVYSSMGFSTHFRIRVYEYRG